MNLQVPDIYIDNEKIDVQMTYSGTFYAYYRDRKFESESMKDLRTKLLKSVAKNVKSPRIDKNVMLISEDKSKFLLGTITTKVFKSEYPTKYRIKMVDGPTEVLKSHVTLYEPISFNEREEYANLRKAYVEASEQLQNFLKKLEKVNIDAIYMKKVDQAIAAREKLLTEELVQTIPTEGTWKLSDWQKKQLDEERFVINTSNQISVEPNEEDEEEKTQDAL